MKLRIRYEDKYQMLELDETAMATLWVSLSLENEELSVTEEERERRIQEVFEVEYNRPEYNCRHQFYRHLGNSKAISSDEDDEEDNLFAEPLMSEVVDDRIFFKDELEREEQWSYEASCQWIRKTLAKKPHWAEAFIAVRMDKVPVNDYATSIGVSDASIVSKWLGRAEKKLQDEYLRRTDGVL